MTYKTGDMVSLRTEKHTFGIVIDRRGKTYDVLWGSIGPDSWLWILNPSRSTSPGAILPVSSGMIVPYSA